MPESTLRPGDHPEAADGGLDDEFRAEEEGRQKKKKKRRVKKEPAGKVCGCHP